MLISMMYKRQVSHYLNAILVSHLLIDMLLFAYEFQNLINDVLGGEAKLLVEYLVGC